MSDPFDETICDRIPGDPSAGGRQGESSILLVVVAGGDADFGRHFVLDGEETRLGREEGGGIVLHDGKISKSHCLFSVIRGARGVERIEIRDLDATNGTLVNGEPVARATLMTGDKIQVGDTVLQLRYGDRVEQEYHARLFQLAARDSLTGLYNKRYALTEAENHLRVARRSGRAFSVILIDIDNFKPVNDRHGHLAGDEFLAAFARLLQESLREQDIAGRIGGEEFLVILPETDVDGACQLATRIRENAEAFVLRSRGREIRCTVSAGVCQYDDTVGSLEEFLDRADRAMYEAKRSGKNAVRLADAP